MCIRDRLGINNAVIRFALEKKSNKSEVFSIGLFTILGGFALTGVLSVFLERVELLKGYTWLKMCIRDRIHRCFSANVAEEKLAYILSFITYGLIGLIKQWFDSNMSLDKHEVVKMADFMVTAAAERLIK